MTALFACLVMGLGAEGFEWPLELPKQVTGTFAEHRGGRLHTGTDIHTGGNGFAVHAPQDGYVERIRCGPYGFGKAVYLRLADGHIAVFGHLSDFRDDLRAYVREAQHAAKNYTVELTPEPNRFPVRRGEEIAKTGDTGIGPSHLHFELRDDKDRPINPCTLGYTWPDKTPPILTRAIIAPRDPESRVNGELEPAVVEFVRDANGGYRCAPVRVRGHFGVGIDLVDPTPAGDKLGVHEVRLLDGEHECFRVRHDLLSYDHLLDAVVGYHPYERPRGEFLLLWRWPGNACESFQEGAADGWLETPAKDTELRVEAADFMGNRATLTIPIVPDSTEPAVPAQPLKPAKGSLSIACTGTFLTINARFTGPEQIPPALTLNASRQVPFIRISDRLFQAAFVPDKGGEYVLRATHPRAEPFEQTVQVFVQGEASRSATIGPMTLHADAATPYGILFAWQATPRNLPAAPAKQLGSPLCIEPDLSPINAPMIIRFPMPDGVKKPERLNVYWRQGSSWICQDTKIVDGQLQITTHNFGAYAVMEDIQEPVISAVSPVNGFQAKNRRPAITATVADTGSGLESVDLSVGGRWLLAAYDPERHRLEWERDEDLPAGRQELILRAKDKAGNVSETRRHFIIP